MKALAHNPKHLQDEKHPTKLALLLEAAALVGADLSSLVRQIPTGVSILGLKGKLLSAISQYRSLLNANVKGVEICAESRLRMLGDVGTLCRRGVRVGFINASGLTPNYYPNILPIGMRGFQDVGKLSCQRGVIFNGGKRGNERVTKGGQTYVSNNIKRKHLPSRGGGSGFKGRNLASRQYFERKRNAMR